jgi:hypothetical protein
MKKTITLLFVFLFLAYQGFSQAKSQRTILVEEFTNASCGPCAAANPAFNALLQSGTNPEKCVPIKYQTNWPGFDPMNTQNPSEVATRVTLYGITGVPHTQMDGMVWHNHPNSFTQAVIDGRYPVSSPFTMTLNHTISADFDSIYVTVVITATDVITGNLVLHTAILEDVIQFATPPGSNGETEFFNVMRKMLPNATGTALPGSWTVGQTQTVDFALALPSYIYSLAQVSTAAWVQDMTTKNVHQAVRNAPNTAGYDMAVTSIEGFSGISCTAFTGTYAVIKNTGTMDVTTCTIKWQLDNGTIDTLAWAGNMLPGDTIHFNLDGVAIPYGGHTLKVWVTNPNGSVDINASNNQKSAGFALANQTFQIPVYSGFQPAAFPPTDWFINNIGNNDKTWVRAAVGAFGASNASAKIPFYDMGSLGEQDEIFLPPMNMTNATAAQLTFIIAHARYSAQYTDRMKVMVSTDCGATWTTPWDKSDPNLATTTTLVTAAFTPSASQWRNESIDMAAYCGQSAVMVKFVSVNGYGNNLYLDDVNLTTAVGLPETIKENAIDVYPNPFSGVANMNINLVKAANVSFEVVNMLGQVVYTRDMGQMANGAFTTTLNSSNFESGVYFVRFNIDNSTLVKKITINN